MSSIRLLKSPLETRGVVGGRPRFTLCPVDRASRFIVEMIQALALKARALLSSLGYRNVSVLVGDRTLGWEEHAPYDAVVISAAAPCIPRPLMEQLKVPGYLVFPMGEKELQTLVRIRKNREGIQEEYLGECRFVRLTGRYGWEE